VNPSAAWDKRGQIINRTKIDAKFFITGRGYHKKTLNKTITLRLEQFMPQLQYFNQFPVDLA
jgi:hypothetical protein